MSDKAWWGDEEFEVHVFPDLPRAVTRIYVRHRPSCLERQMEIDDLASIKTHRSDHIEHAIWEMKRQIMRALTPHKEQKMDDKDERLAQMRKINERLQADLANAIHETDKYRHVCKRLSVELERARHGDKDALKVEGAIRADALEQASEYLMDQGIITTGTDLERICKEIAELPPREKDDDLPF